MIRILCAAVVGITLATAAAADWEAWREQADLVVDANGLTALHVENPRGRVEVRASSDGKLRIQALKLVRDHSDRRARKLAEDIKVSGERHGDRYVIRVRYPQRQSIRVSVLSGFTLPRTEVRLLIEAPRELATTLVSASGDLATEGIAGAQLLKTTSGDIEVDRGGGRVEASTTSGDVTIEEMRGGRVNTVSGDVDVSGARGNLAVRTTSGDVTVGSVEDSLRIDSVSGDLEVRAARGGLWAHTTSGSIDARDVSGQVKIESVSGNARVVLRKEVRGVEISSSSGELTTLIPAGLGCNLDLRTASGSINLELPVRMTSLSRREVRGRIGDGRVPIRLRNSSGDIMVAAGGA